MASVSFREAMSAAEAQRRLERRRPKANEPVPMDCLEAVVWPAASFAFLFFAGTR